MLDTLLFHIITVNVQIACNKEYKFEVVVDYVAEKHCLILLLQDLIKVF